MGSLQNGPIDTELMMTALAWLMTYALHSTVLMGGVWLVFRFFRSIPERMQDGLWKLAMVGGILTATVQVGMGLTPFGGRLFLLAAGEGAAAKNQPPDRIDFMGAVESPSDLAVAEPIAPRLTEKKNSADRLWFTVKRERAEGNSKFERSLAGGNRDAVIAATLPRRAGSMRENALVKERKASSQKRGVTAAPVELISSLPLPVKVATTSQFRAQPDSTPIEAAPMIDEQAQIESQVASKAVITTPWLLLPWMVGLVLACIIVALALLRLKRVLNHRRPLVSGPVAGIFADLVQRSGVRRRVRLSTSGELQVPITFGMIFAEISLPERALTQLDGEQQEAMLAHELAHAVRRDPMWQLISKLITAIFFFQPLNRIANRQLLELAEYLSDDWAVAHTGRELPLASCLTEIARWLVGSPRPLLAPGMAGGSKLSLRVHRLLDDRRDRPNRPARIVRPTAMGFGSLLLFAGVVPGIAAVSSEDFPARHGPMESKSIEHWDDMIEERSVSIAGTRTNLANQPGTGSTASDSIEISGSLLHVIQRTLKTLDQEIEELSQETNSLRTAISKIQSASHLTASVVLIEKRIAELSTQRNALASELPRFTRLIGDESANPSRSDLTLDTRE